MALKVQMPDPNYKSSPSESATPEALCHNCCTLPLPFSPVTRCGCWFVQLLMPVFDPYTVWLRTAPCGRWQSCFIGKWNVWDRVGPGTAAAQPPLPLLRSHREPFYSLWISVKSLSSHTALCSAPLFCTLGGHFSSNSVEERARINNTKSGFSPHVYYFILLL